MRLALFILLLVQTFAFGGACALLWYRKEIQRGQRTRNVVVNIGDGFLMKKQIRVTVPPEGQPVASISSFNPPVNLN